MTTDETMGERENRETAATARSLSVVHIIERDLDDAARLVAGLLDRGTVTDGNLALLAIVPTPDDALSLSEAIRRHRDRDARAITPITSLVRGRRVLEAGATAVAGAPAQLAKLITESRLNLAQLHTVVLVWPEETLADSDHRTALESVVSELPRNAERIAICAARTPDLTDFVERAMWRARTVDHVGPVASVAGSALRVMTATAADRVRALRSMLDAYDPEKTVLMTFTDSGESAAKDAAAVLDAEGGMITVSRGVPEGRFSLGVIYDDIPTAEALQGAMSVANEIVAIVRPTRLAALHKVAGGATPVTWTGAIGNARSAHDALRDEIRGTATAGGHLPWVPLIEPLLSELDAVDVAAAALLLLDRERRKSKQRPAVAAPAPAAPVADRPVRETRPRSSSDRPSERPRDRGDERRGARGEGGRSFGDRGARGFGERGGRPREGGTRGFGERGARPRGAGPERGGRDFGKKPWKRDDDTRRGPRDRPERPARDEREGRSRGGPPRGRDDIERVPRAAREGREWSERGERLRNSRRRDDA